MPSDVRQSEHEARWRHPPEEHGDLAALLPALLGPPHQLLQPTDAAATAGTGGQVTSGVTSAMAASDFNKTKS